MDSNEQQAISSRLVGFEKRLFNAAMQNLADRNNPLRFNNFAYACRELIRHVLERLAPAEKVKRCDWYRVEWDKGDQVTRRQRVYYAVQGGLTDVYVENELRIDIDNTHRRLRDALEALSKYTHVNEQTFDLSQELVDSKASETLGSLLELLELIEELRREIASTLQERVDEASVEAAISETLLEIDELASHHSVESIDVEEIEVVKIDDAFVYFKTIGTIHVELQWGSNSDVRNDMGAVGSMDFPFECVLEAPVDDPASVSTEEGAFSVDTSKWRVYDE